MSSADRWRLRPLDGSCTRLPPARSFTVLARAPTVLGPLARSGDDDGDVVSDVKDLFKVRSLAFCKLDRGAMGQVVEAYNKEGGQCTTHGLANESSSRVPRHR
jgi:hypothetical protein